MTAKSFKAFLPDFMQQNKTNANQQFKQKK